MSEAPPIRYTSREAGVNEYTLTGNDRRDGDVSLQTRDGIYTDRELSRVHQMYRDNIDSWEGKPPPGIAEDGSPIHLQGALFGKHVASMTSVDPSDVNRSMRFDQVKRIVNHPISADRATPEVRTSFASTLYDSAVPYTDIRRAADMNIHIENDLSADHSAYASYNPTVVANVGSSTAKMGFTEQTSRQYSTVAHEMGHILHDQRDSKVRQSHDNINNLRGMDELLAASKRRTFASPTSEGVADGYADLYGTRASYSPTGRRGMLGSYHGDEDPELDINPGYADIFRAPATEEDMIDNRNAPSIYTAMRTVTRTSGSVPDPKFGLSKGDFAGHPSLSGPQWEYAQNSFRVESDTKSDRARYKAAGSLFPEVVEAKERFPTMTQDRLPLYGEAPLPGWTGREVNWKPDNPEEKIWGKWEM